MDQDAINDLRQPHRGSGHFGPRLYLGAPIPVPAKHNVRALICARYASSSYGRATDAQVDFNIRDTNCAVSLGIVFA